MFRFHSRHARMVSVGLFLCRVRDTNTLFTVGVLSIRSLPVAKGNHRESASRLPILCPMRLLPALDELAAAHFDSSNRSQGVCFIRFYPQLSVYCFEICFPLLHTVTVLLR
jgi:hypothetical protein